MVWETTNYKGEPVTWYSQVEMKPSYILTTKEKP